MHNLLASEFILNIPALLGIYSLLYRDILPPSLCTETLSLLTKIHGRYGHDWQGEQEGPEEEGSLEEKP